MKRFLTALLLVVANFFVMPPVDAEIQTYTGTDEYIVGEHETHEVAKNNSKIRAMRNAQDQAGVFIRSRSRMKDLELVDDEVVTLTEGILKVVGAPIHEIRLLGDGKGILIHTTITVEIDTDDLDRRLAEIARVHGTKKVPPQENISPPPDKTVDNIALSQQKTEEGWKFWDEKNFNVAKNLFDETIRLNSQNARAWYGRGTSYDELGQYEQAIQDLNKSIELNPNYAKAYNNRGNAYRHLKQYERAIQDYTRSIQLDPNYDKARNNRGLAYYKLKIYNKALEDFSKAIQLNPKYKKPYANRGRLYTELKKFKQALADFNKSIELDPKYDYAYWYRGQCYEALGEHDKARADFAKARQLGWKG